MSRETQFIGLTRLAEEFVKDLEALPSDTSTSGMFGEKIPLSCWKLPDTEKFKHANEREGSCIREKVQATPWSSGPMIFTCLEIDFGNDAKVDVLQWIDDPRVKGEVDKGQGRFWV